MNFTVIEGTQKRKRIERFLYDVIMSVYNVLTGQTDKLAHFRKLTLGFTNFIWALNTVYSVQRTKFKMPYMQSFLINLDFY